MRAKPDRSYLAALTVETLLEHGGEELYRPPLLFSLCDGSS
jgi:hypothetical protein